MHQFVGEKSWLDKTSVRNITENSERDFFLLCLQTILAVIVQYVQQDATRRTSKKSTGYYIS
jgi:hypothetical protein